MNPVRTSRTNQTIKLAGAGPEHDLPAMTGPCAGVDGLVARGDPGYHLPYVLTVWEPTVEERAAIAAGANVELVVWGTRVPPLSVGINREPIDGPPQRNTPPGPTLWFEMGEPLARDIYAMLQGLETAVAGRELEPGVAERLERLDELRDALRVGIAELELQQRDELNGKR